ncbi:hypothetical protein LLG90_10205 [Aromatoleum toluclasticum]|uniref:hypothetical protein n=1 Tax=Aromatoleum toluclasticum TaxID=92003 RepID=UPI001D198647|nr:hypothetical protein [Aromatoleum toluclasticum]MCC4115720.1 hypothetical protein [Aromatoleum toluclasticum]
MNVQWHCLAECSDVPPEVDPADVFAFDGERDEPAPAGVAGVVLRRAGEVRAEALLAAGAATVFIGEAALRDSAMVERLAAKFGAGRIGLYVPARRMEIGWSFDTTSNADFRVVTPSQCEPCWEILRADGSRCGVRMHWWLGEMMKRGAAAALVQVDIRDDTDLNLCAGLVEDFGERIWLGPLDDRDPAFGDWTTYGRIERIALAPTLFVRRDSLLPAAAPECEVAASGEPA